ncbi:condensation domain-containing protein [Staphylococcus saprophyticus]
MDQSKEIKMSSSQKSFWYLHQILADKSSYNVHFILKFSKNINWDILDKSIDILINKNEILRTTFTFKNSEFVQNIHDKIKKKHIVSQIIVIIKLKNYFLRRLK